MCSIHVPCSGKPQQQSLSLSLDDVDGHNQIGERVVYEWREGEKCRMSVGDIVGVTYSDSTLLDMYKRGSYSVGLAIPQSVWSGGGEI